MRVLQPSQAGPTWFFYLYQRVFYYFYAPFLTTISFRSKTGLHHYFTILQLQISFNNSKIDLMAIFNNTFPQTKRTYIPEQYDLCDERYQNALTSEK